MNSAADIGVVAIPNEILVRPVYAAPKTGVHAGRNAGGNQRIATSYINNCAIAETDEAAMAKTDAYRRNVPSGRMREQALVGTPDAIRRRLAEIEEAGAQEIIVFMQDSKDLESVRLFANECMLK